MNKPDTSKFAFPTAADTVGDITLRQYYAAKAMQGILASGADAELAGFVSKAAYDIADAMIFFEKDHAQAP